MILFLVMRVWGLKVEVEGAIGSNLVGGAAWKLQVAQERCSFGGALALIKDGHASIPPDRVCRLWAWVPGKP